MEERNKEKRRLARIKRLKRLIASLEQDEEQIAYEKEVEQRRKKAEGINQGTENQDRSSNENKSGTTEREPDSTGSN